MNIRKAHKISAITVFIVLSSFWLALIISDFFLGNSALALVRQGIVYALAILIPAMIIAAITGKKLAGKHLVSNPELKKKQKRSMLMAINGALIMAPAAFYLHYKASIGAFDQTFMVIQILELLVGSFQYACVINNIRSGLALKKARLAKASR